MIRITRCPWCEGVVRRCLGTVRSRALDGRPIRVPGVAFWRCAKCDDEFYPAESMTRIDLFRTRRAQKRPRRLARAQ